MLFTYVCTWWQSARLYGETVTLSIGIVAELHPQLLPNSNCKTNEARVVHHRTTVPPYHRTTVGVEASFVYYHRRLYCTNIHTVDIQLSAV